MLPLLNFCLLQVVVVVEQTLVLVVVLVATFLQFKARCQVAALHQ
jgi:hypothetical protein